jgi:hypothetical protein
MVKQVDAGRIQGTHDVRGHQGMRVRIVGQSRALTLQLHYRLADHLQPRRPCKGNPPLSVGGVSVRRVNVINHVRFGGDIRLVLAS